MKSFDKIVVIEEKLASFISGYVKPLREGAGFEKFSDECILYALLEYSKFARHYDNSQRILYLYDKCCEYVGYSKSVKVDFDHCGNFFIICEESLPF